MPAQGLPRIQVVTLLPTDDGLLVLVFSFKISWSHTGALCGKHICGSNTGFYLARYSFFWEDFPAIAALLLDNINSAFIPTCSLC
jgi:hypothetical protein